MSTSTKPFVGYVYFIRCCDAVKIGYSGDPIQRFQGIQVDTPHDLEWLGAKPVHDPKEEKRLHDRFAVHRIRGEWFRAHSEILSVAHEYSHVTIDTLHKLKATADPFPLPVGFVGPLTELQAQRVMNKGRAAPYDVLAFANKHSRALDAQKAAEQPAVLTEAKR